MSPDSADSIAQDARGFKDAGERRTFVERACGEDATLRSEVERLLDDADQEFEFDLPDEIRFESPGETIGRYRLVEEIGQGGFGTVWLAEQLEPIKRRVALKIIKLGMDTRQVVARFEQERQALALMDHPNVARVLDAGVTASGRPYFVMDLVNGRPIGEYCDTNKLTIDERLRLFVQVCGAVQHAHGKGIIHRDLKPSNVLVSTADGKPHATVIDFGIAKATSNKLIEQTLHTAPENVLGTIYYMSPEQAEGSLDIDTRTDVYSLGVLLYELLTGSTPFDPSTFRSAVFGEFQRLLRDVEPPKPSSRISESRVTLNDLAARRCVEPARLGSLVRGELDWIVMKALEKDRSRRYETANGLAMDIGCYLKGEAVTAAPPSATYRLRKFIRRNRGAVAAAMAIAMVLLAGAIGFAWQADVAQDERDAARLAQREAETERRRAETNEQKAAAVNQFLLDMLGSADMRNFGPEAKVSQALDEAALKVGEAFEDRPEVEAAVRQILGRTYVSIGMLDEAEPHVARALELALSVNGAGSREHARCLEDQASLANSRGRFETAAKSYEEALGITKRLLGPLDKVTLTKQCDYANVLVELDRHEEAESLLREALANYRLMFGREDRNTQVIVNSLAVLLHDLKRLDEAEDFYREAVEIGETVLGEDHHDTHTARMNLGSMLRTRRMFEEAEPLLARSYAGIAKAYGDSHTKTAEAAAVLAGLYHDMGRIKDAVPLFEQGVAILRRAEGERTVGVATAKHSLAMVLNKVGERVRAVELMREALEVWMERDGPDGLKVLVCRLDIANTLAAAGKAEEAAVIFDDLLERCPDILGEDHETTIIATNSYGVLLLSQSRFADAEPYLRKALDTGRRIQGEDHRNTLITQYNLSAALRELGRLEEAESLGRDTLERFEVAFGERHVNLANAHAGLAETLSKLGRKDEARRGFVEAIAIWKAALGAKNVAFTSYAFMLGKLMIEMGDVAEAESVLREAIAIRTAARGTEDPRTAVGKVTLGHGLTILRRFAEAESPLLEGHAALVAAHPEVHAEVRNAERRLAELYAAWNDAEADPDRAAKAATWKATADAAQGPESKPVDDR